MADSLLPKDRKKQLMQEITLEPAGGREKTDRTTWSVRDEEEGDGEGHKHEGKKFPFDFSLKAKFLD